MKTYNVYIHSKTDSQDEPQDIILVKDGFNWPCLIFGIFWGLYKRVWSVVFIYIALYIVGSILGKIPLLALTQLFVVKLFISILIAFHANDLWGKSLVKRGYKSSGIVIGTNHDTALLRFLDKKSGTRPLNSPQ